MSNVTIVKGNLFNAPKGSIICHACNTRGIWGAGIAKTFAKKFPEAFKFYNRMCAENGASLRGMTLLLHTDFHIIGCLFTSTAFGSGRDSEEEILEATHDSIKDLIFQNIANRPIHMCKINSGLFGVKWEKTQEVLESFPGQQFTVWEY